MSCEECERLWNDWLGFYTGDGEADVTPEWLNTAIETLAELMVHLAEAGHTIKVSTENT